MVVFVLVLTLVIAQESAVAVNSKSMRGWLWVLRQMVSVVCPSAVSGM
jgi:hypothetical protein